MALLNQYNLNLDIKKRMAAVLPIFRQGDTGGVLTFRIFDDGIALDLSDYTRSELLFILPDGTTHLGTASLSNEIITYNITGIEISKPGDIKVIMSLYSNGSVISVQPFKIGVYDNFRDEEINNISILQDLIAEVTLTTQNAGNEIQRQNNEIQRQSNETERQSNEAERQVNETERQSNEVERQENENQRILRDSAFTTIINNSDFLGTYNQNVEYRRHNNVLYAGSSYVALRDVIGITPNNDGINWRLVASKAENAVVSINGILPNSNGELIFPVIDNLNSNSVSSPLSSNQGRILSERINLNNSYIRKNSFLNDNKSGIVAHRGARVNSPENTLRAIEQAALLGYEIVELDIQRTSDGVMVLMHDDTVDRTTNGTGTIASKTLQQVKQLIVDEPYTGKDPDEVHRIPTLEEACSECKKWGLGINFDGSKLNYTEELIHQAVNTLKKYGIYERSFFVVTNSAQRNLFYSLYPEVNITWLSSDTDPTNNINECKQHVNAFVTYSSSVITDELIATYKENNIPIFVYNLSNGQILYRFFKKGIRFLETDYALPKGVY